MFLDIDQLSTHSVTVSIRSEVFLTEGKQTIDSGNHFALSETDPLDIKIVNNTFI